MFGADDQAHRSLNDVDGGLARILMLTELGALAQRDHRLAQGPFVSTDNRVRGVVAIVGTLEQLPYQCVDRAFLHHSIPCLGGSPVNPLWCRLQLSDRRSTLRCHTLAPYGNVANGDVNQYRVCYSRIGVGMSSIPKFVAYAGIALAALGVSALGAPLAAAEDPPNCTPADLLGVTSGVAASESVYLHTHPDVNDFFNGFKGKSRSEIRSAIDGYMAANPDVKADLDGIRQPVTDFKERCGVAVSPIN